MMRYCEACDRVNRKKSSFCGSCGQPLAIVGKRIEQFSFPIWATMAVLSFFLLPATLIFVALGYTYWSVQAHEVLTTDVSQSVTITLVATLVFYSGFYFFILHQFGHRQSVRIFSYVHIICAVVGAAMSSYFAFLAIRTVAGLTPPSTHDTLAQLSIEQLQSIAYYVLIHYVLFALFYFALLFFSVRVMHIGSQKQRQRTAQMEQIQ